MSGNGEVPGLLTGSALACDHKSAQKPCVCVACTIGNGEPLAVPVKYGFGATSAPMSPFDCTPAVRLSPTPTSLSTGAAAGAPRTAVVGLPSGGIERPPPPEQAANAAAAAAAKTAFLLIRQPPTANRCRIGFAPVRREDRRPPARSPRTPRPD